MTDSDVIRARIILNHIRNKKEDFWLKEREKRALSLFRSASKRVPAYKDFLKKHKINPEKIKTFKDFSSVPETNKKNYLRVYPYKNLLWDGSLAKPLVYTSTSGSTGEPFYFPRSRELDWQSSIFHQLYLEKGFRDSKGPNLVIICFGMGVWIGGLITYKAFEIASLREGHPVSILTPGINKEEIFGALIRLAPHYSQVILIGYPPFIKDIIDEAPARGVNFKKINLRLLFAAEGFTELFRDYLTRKIGIKNPYLDTSNIYGTADLGTIAYETPIAILARRLAINNRKIFESLFSVIDKTPTLAQYNPFFITFESQNNEIFLTGNNAIPLIRYSIGDHGGVLTLGEIIASFKGHGWDLLKEAKNFGIRNNFIYELPFVYIYERIDLSTKLYGAIIYPEHVKMGISIRALEKLLTGKFTLMTKTDKTHNQYLEINLELKPKAKINNLLREKTERAITKSLLERNAEYKNNYNLMPGRVSPKLVFWNYEHPLHFKPGIKQKWVKNVV